MGTATLNISLPGHMIQLVGEVAEKEGYATPSELIQDLLEKHLHEREEHELEQALLDGIKSGDPVEYSREAFESITRNAIESSKASNNKSI